MLALEKRQLQAELLNPHIVDLEKTRLLSKTLGLELRCHADPYLIEAAPFDPLSFDVITCISVVEHIPDDHRAVQKMWNLLTPGGHLILTVPCAAQAREELIDQDEYGLLESNEDGFFFFQRYYDQELLSKIFFAITGKPSRFAVYGEKVPGSYDRNQRRKRGDPDYPLWREPYMMGQEYGYFSSVDELPGVGVIAMEFVKPGA
jgi:SAM-dependent methyltransferase